MQPIDLLSSLSKDIIDMDAILETIRDSHVHGFQSLYDIQVAKFGIRHIDIPLQDFKLAQKIGKETVSRTFPIRYAYQTDIDLVDSEQELLFKKNESIYNTPITIKTVSDNDIVFKRNIIPILDNKLLYTMEVIVAEDNCTLVITLDEEPENYTAKGISKEKFLEYMDRNETLHLLVVPNFYMETTKIPKPELMRTRMVNKTYFSNYSKIIPASTMVFLGLEDQSCADLAMVESNYTTSGIQIPFYAETTNEIINVVTISFEDICKISMFHTNDVEYWSKTSETTELPLPTRNILPFVMKDHRFTIDDTIKIDLYYPNIYKYSNVEDKDVYTFQFYQDDTLDSRYRNALQSLQLVYDRVIDLYKNHTIPEIIRDYQPVEVPMISEEDFKETIYFPDKKNEYIINHLNDYFQKDPELLVRYLYLKLKNTSKFYIDISKLDLTKRKRMSTISDVGEVGEAVNFDDMYYVFNIRKAFVNSPETEFRIYVDRVAISDEDIFTTYNKDHFLIYIRASIIKDDSTIEIERFVQHLNDTREIGTVQNIDTSVTYSKTIIDIGLLSGSSVQPINVIYTDDLQSIMAYNIDILDGEGAFIPSNEYKLYIYNEVVEDFIEIDPIGNYIIDRDFYVVPDEKYLGQSLKVNFNTGYVCNEELVKKSGSSYNVLLSSERKVRQDDVRIFKNGLTMPKERIRIRENGSCDDVIDVVLASELVSGDRINVDLCPFGFKEEFRLDQIENDKGYIDTGDALSYPLDLKWYDIYVNGYKLSKFDIDIISNSRFFIKHVDSLKNVRIMKRCDLTGVFSTQHDNDVNNIIINNLPEFLEKLKEDKDIIEDVATDIIGDAISDVFEHMEFVEKYLEFTFINPNEQQLTQAMKLEYPYLFDEYDILTLSTESDGVNYLTSIDNIRRRYMKRNQYRYGFTPLHVGNHEDAKNGEYMCDPITGSPAMKTKEGNIIASGMLSRLAMHKDRLNNQLMINNFTSVSIYSLDRTSNLLTQEYKPNDNMLDDDVDLNMSFKKMMISFDMDVLEKGEADIMHISSYDPSIKVVYSITDTGEDVELVQKLSQYNESVITVNSIDMTIKSISIVSDPGAPSTIKYILYSILLAF